MKKDDHGSFFKFQGVFNLLLKQPKYKEKTKILKEFFDSFKGDLYLFCKFLLCKQDKRVYVCPKKKKKNH